MNAESKTALEDYRADANDVDHKSISQRGKTLFILKATLTLTGLPVQILISNYILNKCYKSVKPPLTEQPPVATKLMDCWNCH